MEIEESVINPIVEKKKEKKLRSRRIKKLFVVDEDGEIKELSGRVSDVKSLTDFVSVEEEKKAAAKETKQSKRQKSDSPYNEVKTLLTNTYISLIPKTAKHARKQLPLITFASKIAKHILNAACGRDLDATIVKNKKFLSKFVPFAKSFVDKYLSDWLRAYAEWSNETLNSLKTTDEVIAIIDKSINDYFKLQYQHEPNVQLLEKMYQKYNITA